MGAVAKRKVGRPRIVHDDDDDDDLPPPPGASFESPMPWETHRFTKEVHEILNSVQAPRVDDARVHLTLQKHLYRSGIFGTDGRGHITLLIRTILESEGNQDALIEPIVSAVSACMRPEWTGRGLKWIEAFDQIPLVDILTKLRDLDLFPEKELEHHYAMGIQRRLWRIFGPDIVLEAPKPKRARRPLKVKPSATTSLLAA